MSVIAEKERLDYYWKHFALIADQRVKTFNFYILVVLATVTGSIGALWETTPGRTFLLIGAGHMFVVMVFWMIEARGTAILKIAKEALREFEQSAAFGVGTQPLTRDETRDPKGNCKFVTYGNAFRLLFVVHFLFGMLLAICPSAIVARAGTPRTEVSATSNIGETVVEHLMDGSDAMGIVRAAFAR